MDLVNIIKGTERIKNNIVISEYYRRYGKDNDEVFVSDNRARYIADCFKYFDIDYYRKQGIKDIKTISLCHDKFCKNCQNLISKKRYLKFKPVVDSYTDIYDVYHLVLTVPNVTFDLLKVTCNKMYKSFKSFVTRLSRVGKKYNYLIDVGFAGAVRSLEISYNSITNTFHPHFHCILLLRKSLDVERTVINEYSYSNGMFNRKFTEVEFMIQRLWYMCYNNIRVTEDNYINSDYYSCTCDLTCDYKEVFKYTLKDSFDIIFQNYDIFCSVYNALYNRRIIQGYGVLYNISDDIDLCAVDSDYIDLINHLLQVEQPENFVYSLSEVLDDIDNTNIKFISRKSIKGVINNEE